MKFIVPSKAWWLNYNAVPPPPRVLQSGHTSGSKEIRLFKLNCWHVIVASDGTFAQETHGHVVISFYDLSPIGSKVQRQVDPSNLS